MTWLLKLAGVGALLAITFLCLGLLAVILGLFPLDLEVKPLFPPLLQRPKKTPRQELPLPESLTRPDQGALIENPMK
ncbi:hypothetical protein EBT25_15550 [bacterium]|nr:hypothetical protein [bacterium]